MSENLPKNHGARWTDHDREKVFELYRLGRSFKEIANQFNRSETSIELQIREIFLINAINRRKIKHLKHFTDKRNLPSIRKYGLLSRQSLIDREINYIFNDDKRLDQLSHGVCFSVTNLNSHLLNSYRLRFPSREWIEIFVDANILIKSRCLYFSSNAAKSAFSDLRKDFQLGTFKAFEAMFAESIPSSPNASRAGKESHETTCNQAEIIILGNIAKSKILGWKQL